MLFMMGVHVQGMNFSFVWLSYSYVTDCLEHVEQVPGRLIIMQKKKKKTISSETIKKLTFNLHVDDQIWS